MGATAVVITPRTLGLRLSSDRKVSPLSRWAKGKARWEPRILNTLGLPPIATCPGRTRACAGAFASRMPADGESTMSTPCYAASIPWPSVHNLLAANLEALERAGTEHGMTELLDHAVADYRRGHGKYAPDEPMAFRIHWSGDYYREEYAAAWRRVILANPDVRFWSYTRTLDPWCLETLSGLKNHALYLSADDDNADAVATAAAVYSLPIATMSTVKPEPASNGRAITCPVDKGNRPMVSDAGRGGCIECGLCIAGERDIYFPTR